MKTVKTPGASLRVLKNENEVRRLIERAHKTAPKVQPVHIALRGPDLSKNDRKRVEAKIEQIVTIEFNQAQHRILLEQERHRRRGKQSITISLKGLPLPEHDIRLIESKVELGITKLLPRELRGQEIVVCGCGWPFGGCCDPPGYSIYLDRVTNVPPPGPWPPSIGSTIVGAGSSDAWNFRVEHGASHNLTSDQMLVGLASWTDWAKEITAWQKCTCEIARVKQDRASNNPIWMFLTRDQTDTIVFRKPGLFGVWEDVCHIEPTQFWSYLGGKIFTITWLVDTLPGF